MVVLESVLFATKQCPSISLLAYLVATTVIGAERASTFIFLVPVSAILTSWFTLGEVIELHTIVGMLLGVSAVMLINKSK